MYNFNFSPRKVFDRKEEYDGKVLTLETIISLEMVEDIHNITGYDISSFIEACIDAEIASLKNKGAEGKYTYEPKIDVIRID